VDGTYRRRTKKGRIAIVRKGDRRKRLQILGAAALGGGLLLGGILLHRYKKRIGYEYAEKTANKMAWLDRTRRESEQQHAKNMQDLQNSRQTYNAYNANPREHPYYKERMAYWAKVLGYKPGKGIGNFD